MPFKQFTYLLLLRFPPEVSVDADCVAQFDGNCEISNRFICSVLGYQHVSSLINDIEETFREKRNNKNINQNV